jgi:hypothetical protein
MALAKIKEVRTIILLAPADDVPIDAVEALQPASLLQKPLKASLLVAAVCDAIKLKGFQSEAA